MLLALTMVLALCACGGGGDKAGANDDYHLSLIHIYPYHTKMITGIDAAAHAAGYHTAIYNTYWNPRTESHLLDTLDFSRVAGIIFACLLYTSTSRSTAWATALPAATCAPSSGARGMSA